MRGILSLVLNGLLLGLALAAPDPFSLHVRPTEALTPAQELAALHAPPGFKIQLFASEPQINKPMNMAFDVRGRLWVTNTLEYPLPVALDAKGRDSIKILEDTTGDGAADKVSTFVDGLNIPTGIVPYKNGCIAWSIPNIWFFDDTDGDGKCDSRKKLYGPFGWEKDTHGMNSSFRMGLDGWVYATHGFNNTSKVAGTDGHEITMQSGHVYRFRPDGSRIEIYSHGQVNPFGLCFDTRGYLYSADCHSWPITQLIKGAYYPSFGKPHDGLGFGPRMIQHTHDSTGLCGIVYLDHHAWPAAYRDNTLLGDVLNCRVRRDKITFDGSTPTATKREDFIKSDDPWFRPVDLQHGPDGALYIADFYNKIIGHYEVPLDHPGRDRERGRIWRVVSEGIGRSELREQPAHQSAFANWRKVIGGEMETHQFVKSMRQALEGDDDSARIEALRLLLQIPMLDDFEAGMAKSLKSENPHVVRTAAEVAGHQTGGLTGSLVELLVETLRTCPNSDSHLKHTIRIALRDLINAPGTIEALLGVGLAQEESLPIAEFAVNSGSPAGATFVLHHLAKHEDGNALEWLPKVAPLLSDNQYIEAAELARQRFPGNLATQLNILSIFSREQPREQLRTWAIELVEEGLGESATPAWTHSGGRGRSPWFQQSRTSADRSQAPFICSLPPGGEALTGALRSQPFPLPKRLTFFIAGHDGYPDRPPKKGNYIRLLNADDGTELTRSSPPRNDTAQAVVWDLRAHAGKRGLVEVVDGDTGDAYAWLAVGRFSEDALRVDGFSGDPTADLIGVAAEIAGRYLLREAEPALQSKLTADSTPPASKTHIAKALAKFAAQDGSPEAQTLDAVAPLLALPLASEVSSRICAAFIKPDPHLTKHIFSVSGPKVRRRFAENLASSERGASVLVEHAAGYDLLAPSVKVKLDRHTDPSLIERIRLATHNAVAPDAGLDALIQKQVASYTQSSPDRAWGGQVFAKHCAICHQVRGQGKVIGPQLDGVHTRGADRLIEDILAPNRHIDPNFRLLVATLTDRTVVSGMRRGESETALNLIDAIGELVEIPKADIISLTEAPISLMPAGIGEQINTEGLNDLVAFLRQPPHARKPVE